MTPYIHGGIGQLGVGGLLGREERATVIDMRASLAPRLSTDVVHRPVHGGPSSVYGLWTTRRAPR